MTSIIERSTSRKWKITKAIFIVANLLGLFILLVSYKLGAESWNIAVNPVLAYLGTVNSLVGIAYNAANAWSKQYDKDA